MRDQGSRLRPLPEIAGRAKPGEDYDGRDCEQDKGRNIGAGQLIHSPAPLAKLPIGPMSTGPKTAPNVPPSTTFEIAAPRCSGGPLQRLQPSQHHRRVRDPHHHHTNKEDKEGEPAIANKTSALPITPIKSPATIPFLLPMRSMI